MSLMFLDPAGPPLVARYDQIKYPIFTKLTKKMRAFDWQSEEIDVSKDAKDFRKLTDFEQNVLTLNIKRQITLDTKQGSAPGEILGPICTQNDLAVYIRKWSSNEDVHSETYTHIITNAYPNPTSVLDTVLDIEPIMAMRESISKPYDDLETFNLKYKERPRGVHISHPHLFPPYNLYEHKKALWMCINAINALEGIRFYVSFACAWAFAELKKMEGNASLIKLIARDENIHLAGTQNMLKFMPQEDPDMADIQKEMYPEVLKMFQDVVDQEVQWAKFLFKDGSIIGLNEELLTQYVYWIAHKRMLAIGLPSPYQGGSNPLPWTQKWISGSDVQVAPQEKQITMYQNDTKRNADPAKFAGFEL